jgi:hypothetical protein
MTSESGNCYGPIMLDKSKVSGPRLDLQQHLADLEAAGLLIRIDKPIN